MKRILVILLAICMSFPAFAGGSSETDSSTIRVGVMAAMTALPVVDIVNNGLDEANGIDVELVQFTTGAPMNEAMAAGEIDASCIGAAGVFALANFNAKMAAELCDDTVAIELFVRPDNPIASVKGANPDYPDVYGDAGSVKGAVVLCPAGTLSQYEVQRYVDLFGLTMDDIQFVPMEYGQAYSAFVTGEGDILATRSPQTYTAADEMGWVSIASLQNLNASATAQLVVSEKAYKDKADALNTLVCLIYERGDYLNENVDYAAQALADWFAECGQTIDMETSKRQLATKPFYGTADAAEREFGADFRNTLVDFTISSGQLDESQREVTYSNVKADFVEQFK